MNRWKCPDCNGWVANTVQVHYCKTESATGGNSWEPTKTWPANKPYYELYTPVYDTYTPVYDASVVTA